MDLSNLTNIAQSFTGDRSAAFWVLAASGATQLLNFVSPLSDKVTIWSNKLFQNEIISEGLEAVEAIQKAAADEKFTPEETKIVVKELRDLSSAAKRRIKARRKG